MKGRKKERKLKGKDPRNIKKSKGNGKVEIRKKVR